MTQHHDFIKEFVIENGYASREEAISGAYIGRAVSFKELNDDEAHALADLLRGQTRDQVWGKIKAYWSQLGEPKEQGLELAHNDEIVGTEVIDEDGEVVTITQELREAFLMDHGKVEGAFWQIAFALARIKNTKSYLSAGFESFKDYASQALPLGVAQAYGYAQVGDSFKEYEEKLFHSSGMNYGITKAKLIASQGEKEVRRLMKKGKIKFGEEMLSEEELENSTVKDLRALLKLAEQEAEKYTEKAGKAELLEEKLKNADLEMQDLQEFYQDNADRVSDKQQMMDDLEKAMNKIVSAQKLLVRWDISEADEQVIDYFVRITDYMQATVYRLKNMYLEIIEEHMFKREHPGISQAMADRLNETITEVQ